MQRFSYRRTRSKIANGLLVGVLMFVCIYAPFTYENEGWVNSEIIIVFLVLFYLVIVINYCLVTSDVEIDCDSISWLIFGRRWRTIKWSEVNHARVLRIRQFGQRGEKVTYGIYPTNKDKFYFMRGGVLFFDNTIDNFSELKHIVSINLDSRKISLKT
jgi:hypothetical protein